MRSKKLLSIAAAVTALSLGVAACGDDDDEGGDGGGGSADAAVVDLVVGALVPQTGDLSIFAPAGEAAAQLAADQAQAAVEGDASITLEVGDTETKPQPAQQAARQLIDGGASCLAGAWGSAQTIPVGSSVAARQQVPLISPASTSPEITDLPDDGFVFRTAPSDALQGQVLADAVGEEFGTDATISVAARNDAYGEGIATQFAAAFEDAGGTTTGPVLYDPEASSYDSEASDIVAGDPDGFVIIDFEDPYAKVGAALVRTGDFDASKMFTADGLAFGDGVSSSSVPLKSLAGAKGTRPATPEDTDTAQAFDDLFKEEAGDVDRNTFDAQNFDAVMLCFLASVAAGSADGADIAPQITNVASAPGEQYDFTQLGDAVQALLDGEDIDFEGVSGSLDLDENGDPTIANYDVFSYDNKGELTVDETVEKSAGE